MFNELEDINSRPKPFEFYTAAELWTDEHTSEQMLQFHLNESIDLSSRNHAFIDRSVEWIASQFNVTADTAIADFGCGPGIDYAKAAAAEKNLDITYHCQNYLNFEADKRFDLIIMIFCDFCALSPYQRKTLLQKYHTFLKPGGSLLLDVHSLNIFNEKQESATCELNQLNGFWSPNTYYGFVNSFKYDKEKVSLDKYTIIEKNRTRTVYNWLQYFSRESLTHELAENGFNVQDCFSDVAGASFDPESPDMAIIATKP
jgi:SAM-dependent methyltransferase